MSVFRLSQILFLIISSSISHADLEDARVGDAQRCMATVAANARTYDAYFSNCVTCHMQSSNDTKHSMDVCTSNVQQWCKTFANPCQDYATGCALKLGECRQPPPAAEEAPPPGSESTGTCQPPMVKIGGRCSPVCPANTTISATGSCVPMPGKPKPAVTRPEPAKPDPADPGQPATDPQSPGGTNPGVSSADQQMDLQACQSAQSRAHVCCVSDPESCTSGSSSSYMPPPTSAQQNSKQGMAQYCQQMKAAGMSGANANNEASSACLSRHRSCETTCSSLASKWSSINSGVANQLQSMMARCQGYSGQVRVLAQQGLASGSGSSGGAFCNTASTQSAGMPTGGADDESDPGDPFGCEKNPNSPGCVTCTRNPNAPGCQALAAANNGARGEAGFGGGDEKENKGGFNLPDLGSLETDGAGGGINRPSIDPTGRESGTVANGGGAMPGGEGMKPASLGGGGKGGSPGAPGYTTDIDQGMRSGGYSQPGGYNQGADEGGSFGRGGRGVGGGGRAIASEYQGVDLKKFLPGGSHDPMRRMGGFGSRNPQINGPSVDIWQKITTRIQHKCRLGELVGCPN